MNGSYTYKDNLESNRLITRFLDSNDDKLWAEFLNDKRAIEFFPLLSKTSSEELSREWIGKQRERYEDKRFGLQAIIEKATGNFVGQSGLLTQEVDGKAEIEVGYHILPKYWGRGFAPEASKLFIDFTFENQLADSVISIIDLKNIRSQRVAEKNGLTREKETIWKGMTVYIYRIARSKS